MKIFWKSLCHTRPTSCCIRIITDGRCREKDKFEKAEKIHKSIAFGKHSDTEVNEMDKKQQEALNRKKSNDTFNSITQKVKPENQNQQHNARSEAVEPKIRQV